MKNEADPYLFKKGTTIDDVKEYLSHLKESAKNIKDVLKMLPKHLNATKDEIKWLEEYLKKETDFENNMQFFINVANERFSNFEELLKNKEAEEKVK